MTVEQMADEWGGLWVVTMAGGLVVKMDVSTAAAMAAATDATKVASTAASMVG